jgi:hypothetical protein
VGGKNLLRLVDGLQQWIRVVWKTVGKAGNRWATRHPRSDGDRTWRRAWSDSAQVRTRSAPRWGKIWPMSWWVSGLVQSHSGPYCLDGPAPNKYPNKFPISQADPNLQNKKRVFLEL